MPLDNIGQMYLGAIDGKHEYVDSSPSRKLHFDFFLMPQTVNEKSLMAGELYLIKGFRGTGKTSLLRWIAKKMRETGAVGSIVLFKTDVSESKRVEISKSVGAQYIQLDSRTMGVSQDFKEAWRWFLHQKTCEALMEGGLVNKSAEFQKYIKLLGLGEQSWFEKAIAGLPEFETARIKVKSLFDFINVEFKTDVKAGAPMSVPVSRGYRQAGLLSCAPKIKKPLFLCLDELRSSITPLNNTGAT